MLVNNFRYQMLLALGLCVLFLSPELQANGLWGSGAYQGGMICPYETRTASNATSISDDEQEARSYVNELRTEQRRADLEMRRLQRRKDTLRRQIGTYFTSSVANFVADTHIDSGKRCNEYLTSNPRCSEATPPAAPSAPSGDVVATTDSAPSAPPVECGGLMEVPPSLQARWTSRTGAYCVGDTDANAGSVNGSALCADTTLRATLPSGRTRSINTSECSNALSEYRAVILELQNAQDRKAELTEQVRQARESIRDLREEARIERELARTEGDYCTDCDEDSRGYSARPRRDWMSTLVNVGAGIGMMYLGRQNERAANEYNAQAGWPSTQSYGYPYYQAGISGVINGLVGPGAYGCSSGPGGNGLQFGVGANGYGPFGAQQGAFGYPPGYQGSPWGGGMYNPGYGINGMINGPNGGYNTAGQFPYNGAMCIMPPCNIGGVGGNPYGGNPYGGSPFGGPFSGQFGFQIGGGNPYGQNPYGQSPYGNPYGQNPYGGQYGLNGQLSAQYQLQMLQMQQQQQQQYYQMQQQYYQQQLQQQMQQQQLYAQRQQQAMQIQMQMAQLNAQLQALQQQSYYGGGFNGGGYNNGGLINGGFNFGAGFNGSFNVGAPSPVGFPGGGGAYNPYQPPNPYQPGLGPGAYPPGPGGYPPGPGGFPGPYSDPNLGGGIRGR